MGKGGKLKDVDGGAGGSGGIPAEVGYMVNGVAVSFEGYQLFRIANALEYKARKKRRK